MAEKTHEEMRKFKVPTAVFERFLKCALDIQQDSDCLDRQWLLKNFPQSENELFALVSAGLTPDTIFLIGRPCDFKSESEEFAAFMTELEKSNIPLFSFLVHDENKFEGLEAKITGNLKSSIESKLREKPCFKSELFFKFDIANLAAVERVQSSRSSSLSHGSSQGSLRSGDNEDFDSGALSGSLDEQDRQPEPNLSCFKNACEALREENDYYGLEKKDFGIKLAKSGRYCATSLVDANVLAIANPRCALFYK